MRYVAIALSTLMLLGGLACKTADRLSSHGLVTETTSDGVPLPLFTPWDSIPNARAAYLRGYRDGYRGLGGPGRAARVGEMCDLTDPWTEGWQDGALSARVHALQKLEGTD